MEFYTELKSWQISGRSLLLDGGWEGTIALTAAFTGVVQVRLHRSTPWSKEQPAPSLSVNPSDWPELEPPVVEDLGEYLLAAFAGVLVRVDKQPIRFQYWIGEEPDGAPILAEAPDGGIWKDGWQVGVRWALDPADRFYGLGEPDQRKGPIPINHRGQRYPIWNKHLPAPSRLVLPVLVSQRGYGIFVDNPWVAEWDLGADGREFGYTAQGGQLVYYFIAGPGLPTVLERYTRLTGRPSLPPKWTFGLLQSKFGYKSRQEVQELVAAFKEKAIPLDCVILDLYWFKYMGDLAFDRQAFPRPEEMLAELKAQGIHLICIEEPYVTKNSRLFPEGDRLGVLGKRPDGASYTFPFWAGETGLVDFTLPLAKQWWADKHKPLMDLGIDGWWTDLNEPEEHPPEMIHHDGPAAAVHNVFALHMAKALELAQQQHKPEGRLFLMSRAGWPGIQALGAGLWSGDVAASWASLANQIPLGLSMGMAGMVSWNTDIGGFTDGVPSPELYTRWIQFGAFTPIMRPHAAHQPREPWAFGPEAEAIVTAYIRLRYRLLPYTYTLAREAHETGLPLMRPLVLHYQEDPNTFELRDQYLWGRDLLVAPVAEPGAESRKVYLPEGVWYDFWTNRRIMGGRQVKAAAPLQTLPLFVREGAILPLAPERERTGGAWDQLTLAIYPGAAPGSFVLYEDDGKSSAFQGGACARTRFTCAPAGDGLEVGIGATEGRYEGQPAARCYALEVRLPKRPASVVLEGGPELPVRRTGDSLVKALAGWYYDTENRVLHVKLPPTSGDGARVLIQ